MPKRRKKPTPHSSTAVVDVPTQAGPLATETREGLSLATFVPYGAAVFAIGLLVRLVHLWQIRDAPFFPLLMGDAQSYHAWAQGLAAGDWVGSDVFYQAPLYPYFLGLVYSVFGEGSLVVRVCQAALGSLACVFLAYAGWRLFSQRVGLIAGVLLACYAPAIFFDGIVQKSVLDAFFLCLALALLSGLTHEPTRRWPWLWVGVTVGFLVLTRENALVFVFPILFWLLWSQRHLARERFVLVAFLFAGLTAVLLPVAARNLAVSGEFYLTTSQFGPNFYIGNNEDASGIYQPLRPGRGDPRFERQDATSIAELESGGSLSPGEVSRYWTRRTLSYIWSQPLDWVRLMGRKVLLAWNAGEVADTEDQASYADQSFLLRLFGNVWHFGILAPLALVGVWATWPRRRDLTLLYLLLGTYAVTLVGFAIMARYRYPMVPFLMLLAAAGLANIGVLIRSRARHELAIGGVAVIAMAVFANWPVFSMGQMRAVTESNVATELQTQGDLDAAIALYRDSLTRNPNNAVALSNLGTALAANGQSAEAITHYRRALELAPNDADAFFNLGNALAIEGDLAAAADQLREAIRIDPDFAEAFVNLGNILVETGELAEAEQHYQRSTELEPGWVEAYNNLGLLAMSQNRADDALALFRQAVEVDPEYPDAHSNLASALQVQGETEEALGHFRRAVELASESAAAHNDLGMALGAVDQLEEAAERFERAIELEPTFTEARGNLAMTLQFLGRPGEAIAQYREILKLARNPAIYNAIGIALAQQDNQDQRAEAVTRFRQAIGMAPDFADAHGNLATVLQERGELDEAITHFEQAVSLAPDNAEMRSRLAAALAER
ncbi:MAG: tetratricopeptide repeat protein [Acidobacteria bacterium]|nr:tetratricopeptide repeat protein [Acidobacteriota bacterium]